ncbi:MAG: hypothetical protein JOZ41_06080, partial [Chloroflexi bacterium]|nr:hypothetical protein [Chloroflexota bacterium]
TCGSVACYGAEYAPVIAQMPFLAGEFGESVDGSDCTTGGVDALMGWFDQQGAGYSAWDWDTWGGCLQLITDYTTGDPNGNWGTDYRAHVLSLGGANHTSRAGVTGTDGQLYSWQQGPGFTPLGGALLAAPAVGLLPGASGQPPLALYVGLGTDHNLYVRSDSQGWQRLTSTPTYCLDSPALLLSGTVGNASITVACQGGDHGLWTASGSFTSGLPTVGPWSGLGGLLTYGPAMAVVNGQVTYFAISGDSFLYSRTGSSGWARLPWNCIGHPAAATSGTTSYLACQGLNHALYYATNSGGGWAAPAYAGGALVDGPGVAATSGGATFFVEGTDQGLYQTSLPAGGTATTGWAADGGRIQFGAAAAGL